MLAPPLAGNIIGLPDGEFVIAEWTDPGCPSDGPMPIAPLHLHRECDEAWYVLEGTLCVRRGDELVTAPAGSAVYVPRGTPHTYWNPNPEPTRYLLVMTRRTSELIDEIHRLEHRDFATVSSLFDAYGAQLLG